jgi:ribonuclease P protein subunit POP4
VPRRNNEDIARGALIRLDVEVMSSSDPTLTGMRGMVVDETKNTITVRTHNGDKKVPKDVAVFRFSPSKGQGITLEGRSFALRPEDRLRKIHG